MTTTLKKLISEIDFNNKSVQSGINWENLSSELGLYLSWSEDPRLKSYYVGDTKPIKDKLSELKGRFNKYLSCGPGWVFPKSRLDEVTKALTDVQ